MAGHRPGLGIVEDGVLATRDGRIAWVGERRDAPLFDAREVIRGEGRWLTPGLVDCHTHLVWAGDRSREFERRLEGASYEEIAREGGGILATVRATRAASFEELVRAALPRLDALLAEGVTTVEIKSGYGLEPATEYRQLATAAALERERAVRIERTFLGAHALPSEFAKDREGYLRLLCDEMIPRVARERLASAVDVFCERIAFSPEETRRVFEAARAHGLRLKLHADQLSDSGGAALAASFAALSADHLEYANAQGVQAMARAGTVAVLLPGAFYCLREKQLPPIESFRRAGVPMAVATDCNPGTSPLQSLLLALNLAATLFRLTVTECLLGVTRNAARALGLEDDRGTLEIGKRADLALWAIERPAELVYWMGARLLSARWVGA
ncbi:MAG: imidazolonepropionase [Geminicoccaceae bacterium]|nr:imidazolonepropionase [Geminicoccaceae bacterium]MCS7267431.1 imidazolonepropionase [Geminicoccaceae bacterium]MCX7630624.1 imidazolonepropionase [Geminicoccaceae bacterium]MDW8125071.1 imidazolonepropionase [Geminicoccaceae bacterium]MDW8342287.1 imidazolonepropionase [Geminicoccaceae bacterium]